MFIDFGLITGKIVSTDGQLEPTYSRLKGCAYACQDCQELPLDEACCHELAQQLQSSSLRLEMRCPFPEVVDKVRKATAKTGTPPEPKVALLEVEPLPPDQALSLSHPQLAKLLGVPQDQLPPVRLTWSHLSLGPSSGHVVDLHFTVSHLQPKLIAIDKQPNDDVMHLDRAGKADRLAG